ncbi:disease resistance protein RPM1 [Ricinus communis]|uniref:Disease resistance protein RPM1, putative n=1 Tax=Ricinus communis TaxID=3988 RepID=B9SHP9_RICCO|nr:disease resistance protein RPM1 [Ricinus communis]EEF36876.1 Disease resistance protein RPM1, putative [Ricinus communis]|eukprot:XP_002525518.1 disease resistance protein RPM1 [Ricinus communis]
MQRKKNKKEKKEEEEEEEEFTSMAAVPADFLIGKIVSLIENEAALLGGAGDELEEIRWELVSMRSFLEDTEKKRPQTEGEKTWVASVRNLVYDVEDIIDEFMYQTNKRHGRHQFTRTLHKTIGFPKYLWEKHKIASRLQKIKRMTKAIPERNHRYGVDHIEERSVDNERGNIRGESSLFLKDDLVGIENDREVLVEWLTNGESQRTTISVVGMGGSGKTTLAAKAYNCQTVQRHLDCSAWITVSQNYLIDDLFRSLIKQFYQAMKEAVPADLSIMSYRQLVQMLVNYLEPKRYMVVLDDVWDPDLWNQIKISLPNSQHGCRVMITTRKEDIASLSYDVGSHVHHIRPLTNNEAWTLFCIKAFPRNGKRCPPEFEILAKDIVEKCRGLPLAIVALGGLLSAKSSESEWRMIYNSLNWELSNNPMLQSVKSILLLSYNDLPYRLKHCFLYCCLFPEDYPIKRKRLIRLWMAEGFVEKIKGITPEEVAEKYLLELIRRSMLQPVERNSAGLPKACKMHDLVRELALSISEEQKFCAAYDEQSTAAAREDGIARRLSIQAREREIKFCGGMSQLRSFLLFVIDKLNPSSLNALPSDFKLLRVLDLEDAPIEKLPNRIVTLFNMRYLNLKKTRVKELPKSIGRLHNLETLNIDDTNVEALPNGIVKLQNLRYLLCRHFKHGQHYDFNYVTGTQIPAISTLKNLQVLGCIVANGDILRQLRSMTQLVRLDISMVKGSDEMDLCSSIQNMPLLRRLFVMASNGEILRMDALKSPPPQLGRLCLVGKLEKIPQWFHSLMNLRVLYLRWSELDEDPLSDLQELPNLTCLTLVEAYKGRNLTFSKGFNRLEILGLYNCPKLQSIIIAEGVMSGIKELSIDNCRELMRLPFGIQYLTKLEELTLINVSTELTDSIRMPFGMDRRRVKHIPKINNFYSTPSGWFQESLS